ncbi:MAG: hypothetical protein IT450_16970 [Phycisphaerales bacterium]|nr:hypothetical protein [Phycisphaerales bacterium]
MMKRALLPLLSLAALLAGGCPFGASLTTVALKNSTAFPVEVRVRYGANQNVLADILEEAGTEVVQTVPANSTVTFSRDCEELQAIMIENADLQIIGGIGPSQNTGVYRDGSDFGCGDTLTFTFSTSNFLTELEINFAATGN